MSRDSRGFAHTFLCECVDLGAIQEQDYAAPVGRSRPESSCPARSNALEGSARTMLARQRQALILERVRASGAVRVVELARELDVSDMTVRRDLEVLHDQGLLEKVHGGATALSGLASYEPGFTAKTSLQQAEKAAIAAAAVRLVEPGMSIAISAGTTTHVLARRVAEVPGVTIVTNSIRVADVLHRTGRRDQTVILTGGVRTPLRGARRAVRRVPAPLGPPRPCVHGRPRHGCPRRVHVPEPERGRDRSGDDRRGRRLVIVVGPREVGGRRDRVHRPSRPGGRPDHRFAGRAGGAGRARRRGPGAGPRRCTTHPRLIRACRRAGPGPSHRSAATRAN